MALNADRRGWSAFFRDLVSTLIGGIAFAPVAALYKDDDDARHLQELAEKRRALRHAMHDKISTALGMHKANTDKEQQMPETFQKMVADLGVIQVAKAVVKRGHSTAISETEYTEAVTDLAAKRYPDAPRDVAFAKLFSEQSDEAATLRRAYSIIKNFPMMMVVEPVQVDDREATAVTGDPYDALMSKAEALRRSDPGLSVAQAFSKAFTDPANAHLAQKERQQNRPRA
jgi:hypothetical protein